MQRKIVPHVVDKQELALASPQTSVREAARIMARRRIGAVMVMESVDVVIPSLTTRSKVSVCAESPPSGATKVVVAAVGLPSVTAVPPVCVH